MKDKNCRSCIYVDDPCHYLCQECKDYSNLALRPGRWRTIKIPNELVI